MMTTMSCGFSLGAARAIRNRSLVLLSWVFAFVMGQFWDLTTRVWGDEATPLVREIYVPLEGLNQLLPPDAERVFLSRDEYERMLALARRQAPTQSPIDGSILAAEYRAEIRAGRALIVGTVDAEIWTEGWQRVPLKFSGVGLRGAFVNG